MSEEKKRIEAYKATSKKSLDAIERKYRKFHENEIIPFAINTPFSEIAERVISDTQGSWANPVLFYQTRHSTTIGAKALSRKCNEFLKGIMSEYPIDILSITSGMDGDDLCLQVLFRIYGEKPPMGDFFKFIGEKKKAIRKVQTSKLIIPRDVFNNYTDIQVVKNIADNIYPRSWDNDFSDVMKRRENLIKYLMYMLSRFCF